MSLVVPISSPRYPARAPGSTPENTTGTTTTTSCQNSAKSCFMCDAGNETRQLSHLNPREERQCFKPANMQTGAMVFCPVRDAVDITIRVNHILSSPTAVDRTNLYKATRCSHISPLNRLHARHQRCHHPSLCT